MFRRGDILVVNPNLPARPGDYIIARRNDTTMFGRIDSSGLYIEPLAKGALRLPVSSVETLGRVVEKKRIYR